MSTHAQRALNNIGKQNASTAMQELTKMATASNDAVAKQNLNMVSVINRATSATQKYNVANKSLITTLRGINAEGQNVINVLSKSPDGSQKLLNTTVQMAAPDTDLIKQAQTLQRQLTKAAQEYNRALKEGRDTAAAYRKGEINGLLEQITTLRKLANVEGIEKETKEQILALTNEASRAYERQIHLIRQRNQVEADRANKQAAEQVKRTEDEINTDALRTAKQAYADLTQAHSVYLSALKTGDQEDQRRAVNKMNNAQSELTLMKELADSGALYATTQAEINRIAEEGAAAQDSYARAVVRANEAAAEAAKKKQDAEAAGRDKDATAQAEATYRRLIQAQSEYVSALKSGNTSRQEYWQGEIDSSKNTLTAIEQSAAGMNISAEAKQKILQITNDAAQAEAKHMDAVRETKERMDEQRKATEQAEANIRNMAAQLERMVATMVVMRGLTSIWREMTDYAASYYDAMNEIRIVTNYTKEQADALGASYREMAREMSVSSTEIAQAAVEYWRQGLPEADVNERLKYTTAYAKISAMDFTEAAELMTAATNGMELSANRVADVWAYLGDESASGADEIGIAMQKATATAQEAGLSFEWLGSYIATLSEKTRQAPESIGTALNSLMSRIHAIRKTGYNDEDETNINDVNRALGEIDVTLMDQNGEWRDLNLVFDDVAAQWDTMTDKQKAYISTTMAGTRQANYFKTLMQDLSKGVEGGSRAWTLYEGALNSTGTAMEKYAIWEESVEAAQNRLTAATEEFYSMLSGDVIRGWYDMWANVVNGLNDTTEATGGMNLVMGAGAAAVTLLTLSLIKLRTEAGAANISLGKQMISTLTGVTMTANGATVATNMLGIALRSVVAGIAIVGVVQLIRWLVDLRDTAEETAQKTAELAETLQGGFAQSNSLNKFSSELEALQTSTGEANEKIDAFNELRRQMIAAFPEMSDRLGNEVTKVGELEDAYTNAAAALEGLKREQAYDDWTTAHEGVNTAAAAYANARNKQSNSSEAEIAAEMRRLTGSAELMSSYGAYAAMNMETLEGLQAQAEMVQKVLDNTAESVMKDAAALDQSLVREGASLTEVKGALQAYVAEQKKLEESSRWGSDTRRGYQDNISEAQWLLDEIDMYDTCLDRLSDDIKPEIVKVQKEIADELHNSVVTLVTDALNPYEFSKIPMRLLTGMREAMINADWGDATAIEIQEQADKLATMYKEQFNRAIDLSDQIDLHGMNTVLTEQIEQFQADLISELMANGNMDLYDVIWGSVAESIEKARAEAMSMQGETVNNDATDYAAETESQLKAALEMLDKMQTIRDAMNEIMTDGLISPDTLDTLRDEFENEFADIFAPLMDGETWQDRLNELWEGLATDDNMNLLKLFGLQFDDSDTAANALNEAIHEIANAADKDAMLDIWEGLPDGIKASLQEAYPAIQDVLDAIAEQSEKTEKTVETAMQAIVESMKLEDAIDAGEAWSDLDDIMTGIANGGEDAGAAVASVAGHMQDAAEAMGALTAAQQGDAEALEYLAQMTGLTAEQLKANMLPAEYSVAEAANQAGWSATYLANALYAAGAVSIDPSGKLNAIGSIEAAAAKAGVTVAQFASALAALNGASFQLNMSPDGTGGVVSATVSPIKWTGASSSGSRSSGGSSGGGGGSSSTSVSAAVETLLDGIEKAKELRDFRREIAQTTQAYHESRGEIQGVILYLEKEKEIVQENADALEGYIAQIEKEIREKQAAIASNKEGSKAYKQAMTDLEELQAVHQEYSKELIENRTDIENLTAAVKEQYDTIRDMEIDLRDTILEAIEDREEREERMLDGRIEMEEEIMDLLRAWYEKERDDILATQELKRDALNEELDQIDELLAARKKLAEEEDKLQKVTELEEQIARISADPTRQKEAVELQKELNELREELAWDAAEKEAEAQKQSIEQQITSIDDYMDYIEQYYDDLLNNPTKLIAEMQEIIHGTDEEIMDWLATNSEEYQKATTSAQEQMRAEWQETLDDMNGAVRTHWEEVEEVIAGGSDNIIAFLKEHSADYKEAGKLQAEAYVDEWKKQLDDLEAAYKKVSGNIESYNYTETKTSSSSSSGGSSGSGSSTSSSTTSPAKEEPKYHKYEYMDANGNWVTAKHKNAIKQSAYEATKDEAIENWLANGITSGVANRRLRSSTAEDPGEYIHYLGKFKKGGMAYQTGPAWLDGTMENPERILSPYQTKLFEDLIETLHMVRTIGMKPIISAAPSMTEQNNGMHIENIQIQVEKLENDEDYAAAAEKLMNEFYKKINRTRAIGGIQTR